MPHTRTLVALSGRARKPDGANGNVRRANQSFHFCCVDFLWVSSLGAVSHAQDRTRFAPPLSLLGLPLGAWPLRRWCPRSHLQYLARTPWPLLHRPTLDSRRPSLLPPLEPLALSCRRRTGNLAAARERIVPVSRLPEARLLEPRSTQSHPSE